MMDFNDLPQLLQLAVALGLAIAVAGGGGVIIWARFSPMAEKIDTHTQQIAQAETLRNAMQISFDARLKEEETKLAKQLADAKAAFNTQLEIKQAEFSKQLEAVANNFATQKASYDSEIEKKKIAIEELTTAKVNAETERDELKTTIANLNDRIEDIQRQLSAQATKITELQETIREKNTKEKELGETLSAFKTQLAILSDEKQIWVAEKKLVFEFLQALGVKLKALEEIPETPAKPEEINAT